MTTVVLTLFAAVVGALGRFIKGGYFKAVPSIVGYVPLFAIGYLLTYQNGVWAGLVVALVACLGWNPGHGSYMVPGNGSADDEEVAPVVRLLAKPFGWPAGSVPYCLLGIGVRYGLATALTALAMAACNTWLGSDFGLWYAAVGLLATPLLAGLMVIKNAQTRWTAFEIGIGALVYAGLALAV